MIGNDFSLIAMLQKCAQTCDECAAACLKEEEVAKLTECICHNILCATICRAMATALNYGFFKEKLAGLCSEICIECAGVCNLHNHHEHCRECAAICMECAKACKQAA